MIISKVTQLLCSWANNQWPFFSQFIKSIAHNVCDAPRPQPTTADVKTAILLFPGPVVTYRAFRQCAPRFVRASTIQEYQDAVQQLKPLLGTLLSLRVARSSKPTNVFVKGNRNAFPTWPCVHLCQANDYAVKFNLPVHRSISKNIKDFLLHQQAITQEQYDAQ